MNNSSSSTLYAEELKEFDEEQAKITKQFELIQTSRVDLYENEMKLKKRIALQQKAALGLIQQMKDGDKSALSSLQSARETLKKYNNEILNPGR